MKNFFILVLALVASAGTMFAGTVASGTCGASGDNLTWTLDDYGELEISGNGAMADFSITDPSWTPYIASIKSIDIEYGVTNIGNSAFFGCTALTSVSFGYNVTSIGEKAFQGCTGLTSIKLPKSVHSIGLMAFKGCTSLASVVIPHNSVTDIGAQAFQSCTSLKSILLPSCVKSLGDYAFRYCSGLESIVSLSETPPTCGTGCFASVTKTIPVYVPEGKVETYKIANQWSGFAASITTGVFASGTCGENLTWTLNTSGLFIVSGTGKMTSWSASNVVPWNSYQSFIKSAVIGDGVTNIGGYAFYDCDSLSSVTIPNGVTDIEHDAFGYIDGLTSITIPNSVTHIGEDAFRYCKFASIDIPNSVLSIEDGAFSYCGKLTSVTIGSGLTSLGVAFYDSYNLASITVDPANANFCDVDGVLFNKDKTELILFPVGKSATTYTIPNSVKTIGSKAFEDCYYLTSITIPGSVTSIGKWAFYDCSFLTSITCYATTPPTCGTDCFSKVDKSIPVYVPFGKATAYQDPSATGWKDFTNIQEMKCLLASGTCGADGDNLTWELDCDGVLTISGTGNMAVFYGRSYVPWLSHDSSIKKVVIENGVTNIDQYAFYGCSNMTSVTIPNTVTEIRMRAFVGCTGLTAIDIPNSVESISMESFYGCSGLKSLVIPNSVQNILDDAFSKCTGLTSVTIPASVTYIGSSIFEGCSGLNSITVESGNTKFDSRENCNAIIKTATNELIQGCKNTTIPNSVKSIGDYAFWGHTGLTSITIPSNVTSLGYGPFVRTGVTAFSVPSDHPNYCAVDGVLFTKDQTELIAYPGGRNGAYTIPDGVKTVGMFSFNYCEGLTAVTFPEGVETIGAYSFRHCNGLTSVTIPNSVTTIEGYVFRECNQLANVTIGSGLTYLGLCAFWNCTALTSITCNAVTPPKCYGSCFYEVDKDIPVYVPEGTVAAYKDAEEWNEFNNIQEIGGATGIDQVTNDQSQMTNGKSFSNGQLLILRDGKVYTVTGAEVR